MNPTAHFTERPLSALDAIFTRRSVRDFTGMVIDEPTIRALLDAAVQAPTALHEEPWAFVIVQDAATLTRLSDRAKRLWIEQAAHYRNLHTGNRAAERELVEQSARAESIFHDAPTLIVICAKPKGRFVEADCWLAAENLMLAASALGLGTCLVGSAVPVLNDPETKAELGIPPRIEAVAPIVVGVPRRNGERAVRRDADIVAWIRQHHTRERR